VGRTKIQKITGIRMRKFEHIPKISKINVLENYFLEITFHNGVIKLFDCNPYLSNPNYISLKNKVIFKNVKIEAGGYGISWGRDIDFSENELWLKGISNL
jgi:hypothetical protein